MKAIITILTTAMAMTALAIPYQNVARNSELAETDPILVPTPTSKLLPPTESAHVQIHSTHKVLITVTPAATPSASSSPAPSSKSSEDGDGKKVHIISGLMGSLGLDGVMGSLSSLMTGQ